MKRGKEKERKKIKKEDVEGKIGRKLESIEISSVS